jgi:K(+)-stimulated pyrophosphate-energized sodium pump
MSVSAPIGVQARRIVVLTGLGGAAEEVVRSVENDAEVAATMGAGLRTAAAAFGGLAWVGAYAVAGGRAGIDLGQAKALAGVLLGAAIPFLVCSSALMAVGDVALEIVSAVRQQIRRGPEGAKSRDLQSPAVSAGPRKLVVSGLLGLVAPVAVGFGLGAEALGGLLAGATGAGILLSLFLLNVGDAWRGTRRQIEAGAMGGRGSEAHKASAVGDALGEPLKEAAVPTLLAVLQVLAAASVFVAPLLP